MFVLAAVALFGVFIANVVLGAFAGAPFLGDVGEMAVLFAASIAFVVVILQREASSKSEENQEP